MEQRAALVRQWQQATVAPLKPEGLGIIARLYQCNIELYALLLAKVHGGLDIPANNYRSIVNRYHTLRLWGSGFNALNGELDRILQHSNGLYDTTLTVLRVIAETLCNSPCPGTTPGPFDLR